MLHSSRFLICSPWFAKYNASILYEINWNTTELDVFAPLGMKVICERSRAQEIRRVLEQPKFEQIFMPLLRSQEKFYILSEFSGFFSIYFTLEPASTQRGMYLLKFVKQFSDALR